MLTGSYDYPSGRALRGHCDLCFLCRAGSRGPSDGRAGPRLRVLADRRRRGHGAGHLVHALHRDAGFQAACACAAMTGPRSCCRCAWPFLPSAVALYVVSRKSMSLWRAVAGSIVMGAGIAAMHYIGMEAMRSTAMCHYDARLVALSVVLAIVISFVALSARIPVRGRKKRRYLAKNRKRHGHGTCHPGDALYRDGRGQLHGRWHGPGHVARDRASRSLGRRASRSSRS